MDDASAAGPLPPPNLNRPTMFGQDDRVEVIGLRRNLWADGYNTLITASWLQLLLAFAALIVGTNLLFAVGYWLSGGVVNARPGDFRDAFYFSVQTLGTIGYGQMYPVGDPAQLLVLAESMVGILQVALVTGLVFAKFSLPQARVMFSQPVVIGPVDGALTLQFRCANARGNHVVDAEASLSLIRWERTAEGNSLYRMHDLKLVRHRTPAFKNAWLVMHRITEDSPLHGLSAEQAVALDIELAVTLLGIDGTTSQTLHASHSYVATDLRFRARFVDMLVDLPGGGLRLDFTKFHQVEEVER